LNRSLRRLPQIVIAHVHGAAIAGGCAILSACDFIVVAPDCKLGYPVHAIGISPAVTIPTLRLALGDGPARSLLMSGEIIEGSEAHRRGLATHLATSADALPAEVMALAQLLTRKGTHALRATKAWLNELDGSNADANFEPNAQDSANACKSDEARSMLAAYWAQRRA
jgi:enoyl-CoA hydratase/carnithine racemase